MLIFFEAAPAELTTSDPGEMEELFTELIRSSLRGHHLILIDRLCCTWALENLNITRREKAHLEHLRNAFTQRGALRREALVQLIVGLGSYGLQLQDQAFVIGHRQLLIGRFLEKPVLLVENAEADGALLGTVFHAIKRNHPVKDFAYEARHGGGSTIVRCFDTELRERRIVVCVADSDKVAPCSGASATVQALTKTSQLQTYVGKLFVTGCREIENHIPLRIIQEHGLCPQYPHFDKLTQRLLSQPAANEKERLWLYLDLKAGFRGIEVAAKPYHQNVHAWIEEHYGQGEPISNLTLAGFGDALMQSFLRSGAAIADFARHVLSDEWRRVFGAFFDEMLWYFLAERKRPAI